jgi:hypothetical protein
MTEGRPWALPFPKEPLLCWVAWLSPGDKISVSCFYQPGGSHHPPTKFLH